ncbi:unnamed protein product, partial [Amoebophrya sp. A25]|eukprot:GSA25T00004301001.1
MAFIPKGKRLKKGGGRGRRRKGKTAAAVAVLLSMQQQVQVEGYQTDGGTTTSSSRNPLNKRGQRLRGATTGNTPLHTPVFTPARRSSADQAFLEKCDGDSSCCGDSDETSASPNKGPVKAKAKADTPPPAPKQEPPAEESAPA